MIIIFGDKYIIIGARLLIFTVPETTKKQRKLTSFIKNFCLLYISILFTNAADRQRLCDGLELEV